MKQNIVLSLFVALMALLVFSIPCNGQPKNIQAKVIEILKVDGRKVNCKAISLQGDTVFINYGFRSKKATSLLSVGTWVSIWGDYSDLQKVWYCRRVKING